MIFTKTTLQSHHELIDEYNIKILAYNTTVNISVLSYII